MELPSIDPPRKNGYILNIRFILSLLSRSMRLNIDDSLSATHISFTDNRQIFYAIRPGICKIIILYDLTERTIKAKRFNDFNIQ